VTLARGASPYPAVLPPPIPDVTVCLSGVLPYHGSARAMRGRPVGSGVPAPDFRSIGSSSNDGWQRPAAPQEAVNPDPILDKGLPPLRARRRVPGTRRACHDSRCCCPLLRWLGAAGRRAARPWQGVRREWHPEAAESRRPRPGRPGRGPQASAGVRATRARCPSADRSALLDRQ
jgi:hypothetical protein